VDPSTNRPLLSVVIPVRDNGPQLRECLRALHESTFQDFETVVVDDGSVSDTSKDVATFDVQLVEHSQPKGPAAARNVGARECRGEILLFLDADVCVHHDTLERIVADFAADTTVDAVFGSYDANPTVPNLVSRYRNLMHHFFHQTAKEEATTFWAGCGAIRRSVFWERGGFDVAYDSASVEDVDLGMRLRESGRHIRVDKRVLVTHQKHWTLWNLVKVDIFYRGIPWTRLLLRHRWIPNDLNVKWTQRVAAVLAWALVGTLTFACWQYPWLLTSPLAAILLVAFMDSLTHKPALAVALECLVSAVVLSTFVAYAAFFGWWVLVPLVLALAIVVINHWFYRFLAQQGRITFAIFVFPLHLLYYLYSSVAFVMGVALYFWQPPSTVAPELRQTHPPELETPTPPTDCSAGKRSPGSTVQPVANGTP
jgi:glycosyltransferase involved in cell wall biosynthesis